MKSADGKETDIARLDGPFRSEFIRLVQDGAAAVDVVGHDVVGGASERFIGRELDRPLEHQRNICPYIQHLRPARVLDVGCGTGGLTVALCATFPDASVVGVDAVPITIAAARVRAEGCRAGARFEVVSASGPLPFPDRSFDLVTCTSVIEFITEAAARRQFARELTRVARQHVLLTTPNPLFRLREQHTRRWFGDFRRDPAFPWASTPRELGRLFHPFRRLPLPQRVRDKVRLPALPGPLVCTLELLMPWQFALYVAPEQ